MKLNRRQVTQTAMWTLVIVLFAPGRDLPARIPEVRKPTHIQAFIAQPAVEAFHFGVLHRLAWFDVFQLNL